MNEVKINDNLNFNVIQISAIVIAIIGIILGLVGAASDSDRFWHAYLFGYLFWLQLSLGGLGMLLVASAFDARWSFAINRFAGAAARTLPLLAILGIPLLVTLETVFPWAKDSAELGDEKEIYFSTAFFIFRYVLYFAIWIGLAYAITELGYQNDRNEDEAARFRIKQLSVLGVILFMLSVTFYSFDWILSLDYNSFSSVYGWLAMSSQAVFAMSFFVMVMAFYWKRDPLNQIATPKTMNDISALMLVSLMVWGYLNVMQFIIFWSGNIPKKIDYYFIRTEGGWEGLGIFMILLHVAAFVLLITPVIRRSLAVLPIIAALLFLARAFQLYYIAFPPFYEEIAFEAWDIALLLGFGGFWVALYFWFLNRKPILPMNEPAMERLIASGDHEMYDTSGGVVPRVLTYEPKN